MSKTLPLALLGLMMLAPAALADGNETAPADHPTMADCPPGKMCSGSAPGNGTDEPTYGDCGREVCAYGDPGCIECSGPVPDHTEPLSTCMDGAAANEECRDDVYYLGGEEPSRGPADGSCEACRGPESGPAPAEVHTAAGFGAAALLGAAALAMAVLRRR